MTCLQILWSFFCLFCFGFILFWGHTQLASGVTPGSVLKLLLLVLKGPWEMPGIKPGLAECKGSVLSAVLTLQPHKLCINIRYQNSMTWEMGDFFSFFFFSFNLDSGSVGLRGTWHSLQITTGHAFDYQDFIYSYYLSLDNAYIWHADIKTTVIC